MDVFLVRHAAAIDETVEQRDPHRHLTAHGREQATRLGDRLRWHDCAPTLIWTSPLVRAVQTAELVAHGLESKLAIEAWPALAPGESTKALVVALQALPADARVLVVGHEPGLSALGGLLIGGELEGLGKAEAVRITDGRLRWRFAWDADAPIIAAGTGS